MVAIGGRFPTQRCFLSPAFSSSPHLEYFDFYYQDEQGKWQVQKSGYAVPWEQRPVQYITPAFLLPHRKAGLYYLRMNNKSISFSLIITTGRGFVWHNLNRFLFFGFVSGLFLFVIVNNLYFAYALPSRTHLIYSFLAVSYWLFAASYEGYWFLVVRHWDWYARHYSDIGYAVISGLMIVMMPIYAVSFFKPPKNSVWHRLRYFFLLFFHH
ncbi:MAG: hypothetical protein HC913_21500 [Microscillaceae bacterium]|nr:hypothetical protein [Microscillaceae bacterium]